MKFTNIIALVGFTQAVRLSRPPLPPPAGGPAAGGPAAARAFAQVQDPEDERPFMQVLQFDVLTAVEALLNDADIASGGTDAAVPLSAIEAWVWDNKGADIHTFVNAEINEAIARWDI